MLTLPEAAASTRTPASVIRAPHWASSWRVSS